MTWRIVWRAAPSLDDLFNEWIQLVSPYLRRLCADIYLTVASLASLPPLLLVSLNTLHMNLRLGRELRMGATVDMLDLCQCFVGSWTLFTLSALYTNRVWICEWYLVSRWIFRWVRIELDVSRDEGRVCEEMHGVLDSLGQRSIDHKLIVSPRLLQSALFSRKR